MNVDLGGVGQRHTEADPFATGGGSTNAPHTEEKHKTKTKDHESTTADTFSQVQLTGEQAKDETKPDMPPGTFNVSDNQPSPAPKEEKSGGSTTDNSPKTTDNPPAQSDSSKTEEKPAEKKFVPKPSWSKPIQDWLDLRQARIDAENDSKTASDSYQTGLNEFLGKSQHLGDLIKQAHEARAKAEAKGATQADKDAYEKAMKEENAQFAALERDFANTPEGQTATTVVRDAKKKVAGAKKAEEEAAKEIDKKTQKMVLNKMAKWQATQTAQNGQEKK